MDQQNKIETSSVQEIFRREIKPALQVQKKTSWLDYLDVCKQKQIGSVYLHNCKYELVRKVALRFYVMKEVLQTEHWNLYWSDNTISPEICQKMKPDQTINHFPGMFNICSKIKLSKHLNHMSSLYPYDFDFYPRTWVFPDGIQWARSYARMKKDTVFIFKPERGCQGRGIIISDDIQDNKVRNMRLCQLYIQNPLLINGYKCDFRVYVLIASIRPLKIFIYDEGLVRLATTKYEKPNKIHFNNKYMHLTNVAINKTNPKYNTHCKKKLSTIREWLYNKSSRSSELWQRVDDAIIKTILSIYDDLNSTYKVLFPYHKNKSACFELLGFDFLLDETLKPYILEVNHTPSFNTETSIDEEVKQNLLIDTFELLKLYEAGGDTGISHLLTCSSSVGSNDHTVGHFRRVYPTQHSNKYKKFFNKNFTFSSMPAKQEAAPQHVLRKMKNFKNRRCSCFYCKYYSDKNVKELKGLEMNIFKIGMTLSAKKN